MQSVLHCASAGCGTCSRCKCFVWLRCTCVLQQAVHNQVRIFYGRHRYGSFVQQAARPRWSKDLVTSPQDIAKMSLVVTSRWFCCRGVVLLNMIDDSLYNRLVHIIIEWMSRYENSFLWLQFLLLQPGDQPNCMPVAPPPSASVVWALVATVATDLATRRRRRQLCLRACDTRPTSL